MRAGSGLMESLDQLEVSTTAESFPTTLLAGQVSAFSHRWVPAVCRRGTRTSTAASWSTWSCCRPGAPSLCRAISITRSSLRTKAVFQLFPGSTAILLGYDSCSHASALRSGSPTAAQVRRRRVASRQACGRGCISCTTRACCTASPRRVGVAVGVGVGAARRWRRSGTGGGSTRGRRRSGCGRVAPTEKNVAFAGEPVVGLRCPRILARNRLARGAA